MSMYTVTGKGGWYSPLPLRQISGLPCSWSEQFLRLARVGLEKQIMTIKIILKRSISMTKFVMPTSNSLQGW